MGLRGSDTTWYYSYFVAQPAREHRNPNPRVSASLPWKPKAINPGGLGAGPQLEGQSIRRVGITKDGRGITFVERQIPFCEAFRVFLALLSHIIPEAHCAYEIQGPAVFTAYSVSVFIRTISFPDPVLQLNDFLRRGIRDGLQILPHHLLQCFRFSHTALPPSARFAVEAVT